MSVLNAKHFHDEAAAIAYVEARVWPDGPACPHCGSMERIGKLQGKSTRIGTRKCYDCRKPFTVKVGTIFEDSHVPMHLWLQAIMLVAGSKKGISSNQLHRTLGVTLKTAWFMSHRIRHAMASNDKSLMGSGGGVVEADETYIGRKRNRRVRAAHWHKHTVFTLVERGRGARSIYITGKTFDGIKKALKKHVSPDAHLMTDQAKMYRKIAKAFASHQTVNHSIDEYVRGNAHTNTVESFFSVFKRGMVGVYQHCTADHLHRYLSEFDFRYCNRVALGVNDGERANRLIENVVGKRLTYQTTCS